MEDSELRKRAQDISDKANLPTGRFKKKPVVVDAIRVAEAIRAARDEWKALPEWLSAAYEAGAILFGNKSVMIRTLEGTREGLLNDWIIRGVKGELYPCKPDIFKATYDRVE